MFFFGWFRCLFSFSFFFPLAKSAERLLLTDGLAIVENGMCEMRCVAREQMESCSQGENNTNC